MTEPHPQADRDLAPVAVLLGDRARMAMLAALADDHVLTPRGEQLVIGLGLDPADLVGVSAATVGKATVPTTTCSCKLYYRT